MSIEQLDKIITVASFVWMLFITVLSMCVVFLIRQPLDEIKDVLTKILENNNGYYRS